MLPLLDYLRHLAIQLDNLLIVAKNLRDLTTQMFCEKEVVSYQLEQKKILTDIANISQILEVNYHHQIDKTDQQNLRNKIHKFQKLNQEYIQNLKKNHGLIQFELAHSHSQNEEIEKLSDQLNEVTLSPNRPQTVKAKKTKKG